MKDILNQRKRRKSYSDQEIIDDILRCAKILGKDTITRDEYDSIPGINCASRVAKRFDGWFNVLRLAGLKESRSPINIDQDELLENLMNVSKQLCRLPTYSEMKSPLSRFSSGTYENRFGSWNNALDEFERWVISDENEESIEKPNQNDLKLNEAPKIVHKTKREISDRMRFRILMRDGFICRSCGASPLKDNRIELHVDHKLPWSLGGETVEENLITKCQQCNLGKSNLFIE